MSDNFSGVVDSAASDDFVSVEKQFSQMMQSRLNDSISGIKVDIAKHIFAGPFEVDPQPDTETNEPEAELSDDEINDLLDTIDEPEEEEDSEESP